MRNQEFDSLSDEGLVLACIEPTVLRMRRLDRSARAELHSELTEGQLALWMFRVLYPAANGSAAEYSSWISHLLEQPDYWPGVTGGLRYFGETTMLRLLEGTREVLEAVPQAVALEEDPLIAQCMNVFYEDFRQIATNSLRRISAFIRSNPGQFVRLVS